MQRAEKKVDRSSVFPLGVLRVVCQYLSQYSSLKALGGATFFFIWKSRREKRFQRGAFSRSKKVLTREKAEKMNCCPSSVPVPLWAESVCLDSTEIKRILFTHGPCDVTKAIWRRWTSSMTWCVASVHYAVRHFGEKCNFCGSKSSKSRFGSGIREIFKKLFCWSLHSEICIKDANSAESSSTATFAQNDDFYLNWWNWKLKDFGPWTQDVMDWSSSLDWWRIC